MDMPHSTIHVYLVWKAGMTNIMLELSRHKEKQARKEEAGSVKS